jgi:chromosome segregation ATPase
MTIKQFITMNPLLSAGISVCLAIIIYYLFSTLYAAGQIAILNRANTQLEKQVATIQKDRDELTIKVAERDGVIANKEKELEKTNALLQAASVKIVESKKSLDDTVTRANTILSDKSPMSDDELKQKLCSLYNIAPSACK